MIKTLQSEWETFKGAHRQDLPPLMLKVMQRSFYAGAMAFFNCAFTNLDPGTEPTENDLNQISVIHDELDTFYAQVGRGEI